MAAHTHVTQDSEQPWYLDSGANNHVTADLENLTQQQPYQGTDSGTVGNGGGLHIANTGYNLISTHKTLLHLHNILHCPNASSNLLSIQKFCKDLFYSLFFFFFFVTNIALKTREHYNPQGEEKPKGGSLPLKIEKEGGGGK